MGIISIFVPKVINNESMNRKTLLFLFFALMLSPFTILAQSLTVSGKVVSSDDGNGLPGHEIGPRDLGRLPPCVLAALACCDDHGQPPIHQSIAARTNPSARAKVSFI